MDSNLEDFIYDDVPEMQDLTTSSNDAQRSLLNISSIRTSSSSAESWPLLPLTLANSTKDDLSTTNLTKIALKRCVCRGNIQWTWDHHNKSENAEILNNNMEVKFNNKYSNGTAMVRCTEPMSNHQYYWEIKMNYPVYGTDIMIGVGTPEATIAYIPDRYVSRLGMDEQTWGFSYHGFFHHNGEKRCYAQKFDQGDVIGVHLDLWRGTLSFYKDRKYLGVACSGLQDKTLYAMASSTAARSGMQILHAFCFPSSLQFMCAVKLRELVPDDKNVLDAIHVPPGLKQFLQIHLSWLLDERQFKEDFKACCMTNNTTLHHNEIDNKPTSNMSLLIPSSSTRNISNESSAIGTETMSRGDSPERNAKRPQTSD